LCRQIGDEYCQSNGLLHECTNYQKDFCCWNSVLARLIAEQGRAQLGIGWGSQRTPNCRGFTQAELEKIDFEAVFAFRRRNDPFGQDGNVDFTDFEATIMSDIELPDEEAMKKKAGNAATAAAGR
jgi:hypothetical protein